MDISGFFKGALIGTALAVYPFVYWLFLELVDWAVSKIRKNKISKKNNG